MILPGKKQYRIALFAASLIIQAILWMVLGEEGSPPGDYDYVRVGNEFLKGDFANTFKPPFYSFFLIPSLLTSGPGWLMFVMQMLLWGLSVVLTDRLCERLGFGKTVAMIAIIFELFYPYYATSFMKVSDVVLNLVFIKWLLISYPDKSATWNKYFVFGLIAGFYAYLRPNVYVLIPAFLLFEILARKEKVRSLIKPYFALSIGILLAVIPWLIWTWQVNGVPSLTTTNSGYNLLIGHNKYAEEFIGTKKFPTPEYVVWQHPEMFCRDWVHPIQCDSINRSAAMKYIREHPDQQLKLVWLKFVRYWEFRLPDEESIIKNLGYTIPYLIILIGGILGMFLGLKRHSSGIILLVGIQVFHMIPFLVYFSTIRMRVHLDFILMIFLGYLANELIKRRQIRKDV